MRIFLDVIAGLCLWSAVSVALAPLVGAFLARRTG